LRGGGVRPSSGITAIAAVITAIAFLLTGALLLLAALITPGHNGTCADATGATRLAVASDAATGRLTAVQRRNAAAIITIGRQRNLPDQAIVIALATASQESGFTNYANDGRGGDLIWSQAGVERSLRLPHEAVGTDHGSLGVFQQQWPWWGSMAQLMNPAGAADKFYDSLLQVAGWETMPVTVAAQRVQRSAFPSAYADDEPLARSMLETVGGPSSARDSVADCSPAASSGPSRSPFRCAAAMWIGGTGVGQAAIGRTAIPAPTSPSPAAHPYSPPPPARPSFAPTRRGPDGGSFRSAPAAAGSLPGTHTCAESTYTPATP
jgi:hypothetical protein